MPSRRSSVALSRLNSWRSCCRPACRLTSCDRRSDCFAARSASGEWRATVVASFRAYSSVNAAGWISLTSPACCAWRASILSPLQHHSAGQRLAYAADQPLGAARARHNAEGNFRQAKTGVVAGDNQVAQQGQLAAGAKRVAVDRSDERFSESINCAHNRGRISSRVAGRSFSAISLRSAPAAKNAGCR